MTPDSEQHPPTERPPISRSAKAAFILGLLGGIAGGVCWLDAWLHWTDWQLPPWLDVPLMLALAATPAVLLGTVCLAVSALAQIRRLRGQVSGTALATAAILLCIPYPTSIFGAIYQKELAANKTAACISNASQLGLATHRYLSDHDNTYPSASTWCDDLKPYVDHERLFVCPGARKLRSGYAYNAALSRVRHDAIAEPDKVVVFFESDAGWNGAGGPELRPEKPRHRRGTDAYCFADGHAGTYSRADASEFQWEPKLRQPVSK